MEWIKIEERLPEPNQRVLLTDGVVYKVGHISDDKVYWHIDEVVEYLPDIPVMFTHWMLIPLLS